MERRTVAHCLYLRPRAAEGDADRDPESHLERLLWSYNADLEVQFTVAYGMPLFDPYSENKFDVAFVDEDVLPSILAPAGLSPEALRADKLVYVKSASSSRAVLPFSAHASPSSCIVVSRPFSYERFCELCALQIAPDLKPSPQRFEYHTWDVIRDIWSESAPRARDPSDARRRYKFAQALCADSAEAIVITRREPPFEVLFANQSFWRAVGWPESMTGHSLRFLQGPLTDPAVLAAMHAQLTSETMREHGLGEWRGTLVNYTMRDEPFVNKLRITPCLDAALYVGVMSVERGDGDTPQNLNSDEGLSLSTAVAPPHAESMETGEETETASERAGSGQSACPPSKLLGAVLAQVLLEKRSCVALADVEPPHIMRFVNRPWCELIGCSPVDAVGRSLSLLVGPRTADPEGVQRMAGRALSSREPVVESLVHYKCGGRPFANRMTLQVLRDEHGVERHLVLLCVEEQLSGGSLQSCCDAQQDGALLERSLVPRRKLSEGSNDRASYDGAGPRPRPAMWRPSGTVDGLLAVSRHLGGARPSSAFGLGAAVDRSIS